MAAKWERFWTPRRQRVYPWIVAVLVIGWFAAYCLAGKGNHDFSGEVIGHDFITSYATSNLVRAGESAEAYRPDVIYRAEDAIEHTGHQSLWSYPPLFLLVVAPLSLLPYAVSFGVWESLQIALFAGAFRLLTRAKSAVALAVGSPFVLINLGYGQNGLLSAGILGLGFSQLMRRPILAGTVLGTIVYKPQIAMLVPVFLLVTKSWRALSAFTATAAALCVLSAAVFGIDTWRAFFDSLHLPLEALEQGRLQMDLMPTVEAAGLRVGMPLRLSRSAQYIVMAVVSAVCLFVWARHGSLVRKAALLPPATLLITPYAYSYDLAVLMVSAGLLAWQASATGWRRGDKVAIGAMWAAPLLALLAQVSFPLMPPFIAGIFAYLAQRQFRTDDIEKSTGNSFAGAGAAPSGA